MKKDIQFAKTFFYIYLSYRLNFILWRFRNFLWLIFLYFFWKAVFQNSLSLFGYSRQEIFLYILIAQIVSSFIVSTTTGEIGSLINSGKLTYFLLLPFSFFRYMAIREVVDKMLNVFFSFFEILIFILIFKPTVDFSLSWNKIFLALFVLVLAIILYFLVVLNLGFIGFWSTEVWAPRFLFMILVWTLTGGFFPLDILPDKIYKTLMLLPFPYLTYFPVKVFMGKVDIESVFNGSLILALWIFVFIFITKKIWERGLKIYTAQGI